MKTKGFIKPSYIINPSKNQLGNTLIPVIIALGISAIASIAFLRQGADLSTQAKVLKAQYEIVDLLQYWNIAKKMKDINTIMLSDLPPGIITEPGFNKTGSRVLGPLALGWGLWFEKVTVTLSTDTTSTVTPSEYFVLKYFIKDGKECLMLASMLSSKMLGISNLQYTGMGNYLNSGNPVCVHGYLGHFLAIRLD